MNVNGRILRANTRTFVFGTRVPKEDVPVFGAFVKTRIQRKDATVFGLIYDIVVEDDGMTRMLSVAEDGLVRPEEIEWQRSRRVPIEVSVLCVGYRDGGSAGSPIRQVIPPQPPITLDEVVSCTKDEVQQFTQRLDFFRLVLEAHDAPCDELLAASLRLASETHSDPRAFLRQCGRELARLLANDGARLDGLLRRLI
ncbi:MAG: hypothetical protein RMN52_12145 [Anaerolineae bacterium]|nr:hypothetical protein [Candidatus Roseilinea sp.]MDW8450742.1 hypothetical protein [Anaerolineae bacterium]